MRFAFILVPLGLGIMGPASAQALDCEVLRQRVAAVENPAHAAALKIVRKEDVGDAQVKGHCAGDTKRLILPRSSAVAAKVPINVVAHGAAVQSGTRTPGIHENIGPKVCVNGTSTSVTAEFPGCTGSVTDDAVLSAISKASGLVGAEALSAIANALNRAGWGASRSQDFAECRLVCTTIPTGVAFTDTDITMWFGLHGPKIEGPMGKKDEGRWGPGWEGFWRVDPGYHVLGTVGDNQIVCKQGRNWASWSRLFQLHIKYKLGTSSKVIPPHESHDVVACTNGLTAPK
jgi:hypothetical protein